jgi:hypothetical protein
MPIPMPAPAASKTLPTTVLKAGGPATKEQREAAERLGSVYLKLARRRQTPFGAWAIVSPKGQSQNYTPFTVVLGEVYGADADRLLRYGPKAPSRFQLYRKDCDTIFTGVTESAIAYATLAINSSVIALTTLMKRIVNEKGIADRLHKESEEIVAALRREMRKEEAERAGLPPPPEPEASADPGRTVVSPLSPEDVKKIIREKIVKMVPYAGDEVLSILFEHPEGMKILGAYAESGDKGTVAATIRISQAIDALEQFTEAAIDRKRALAYPFFVVGGVVQRQLRTVPGFTEFAINLAQATVRDRRESQLTFAMIAIGILALIICGPEAPLLFAGVMLGGADLALAGMNVGVVFAREREQDLAYKSTQFKPESSRWATAVVYQDTILAGTAALLSAIAVFKAAKELHTVLKPPAKGAPAPKTEGQRLTNPENKVADGQPNQTSRGAGPDNAITDNKGVNPPPAAGQATESKEVQQPKTSKDLEWRRPGQGEEAIEAAGAKKPTVVDESKSASPQQRLTKRPVETPDVPSAKEKVPLREFLESERKNLDQQIVDKAKEMAAHNAELDKVRAQMNAAAVERNKARKSARTPEEKRKLAELEAEYERLRDQFNGFDIPSLAEEKLALSALRSRNTTEYFDALSSAAAGKREYASVAGGKLDDVFLPFEGKLSVEHVMARSAMFQKAGFIDKIIWEQQIFLFNLRKNLKVAPVPFNSARGAARYTQLPRGASKFIKSESLGDMMKLEAEVERDIEQLLANAKNPTLWKSYGYTGPFK